MYFPPKIEFNLEEVLKVAKVAHNLGFLDQHVVSNFLATDMHLLGNVDFSYQINNKCKDLLDKVKPEFLIQQLNSYYITYAGTNLTGFLLYVVFYLQCKSRFSELMALNYAKLPDRELLLNKLKEIVLAIYESKSNVN